MIGCIGSMFDNEKVLGEKLNGVDYIERSAVYGIVINKEGSVAVIKTLTGYFLPGGGIENEETHKECLDREFVEETGYEIIIEKYVGKSSLYHLSKTNQHIHGIGYFYMVSLSCMTNKKSEDDHELVWIEKAECIKNLFLKHQAWAVSKVLNVDFECN